MNWKLKKLKKKNFSHTIVFIFYVYKINFWIELRYLWLTEVSPAAEVKMFLILWRSFWKQKKLIYVMASIQYNFFVNNTIYLYIFFLITI